MQNNIEWDDLYQQGKTGWDRGEVSPNLLYWLERDLLKPCRILVPGCGNGHEVLALAGRGFDVVAIDIALTPVENLKQMLKKHQLSAEIVQEDFLAWQCKKPFDAIYEQTSLCALPPDKWMAYENCLYEWLKPTGKLFAQFMQTEQEGGPPFHCDINAMVNLFTAERWRWSEEHETQVIHSGDFYEKAFLLERAL